jgi:predicted acetyltransferase
MQLSIADHTDILQITRQVYDLWSAGLKKADYRQLFWSTYHQSWSKRHTLRMVHKIENEVAFSCKTAHLSFIKKNCYYRILGLGAIFTAPNCRKHGLAANLIESLIDQAEKQNLDGVLLFSAIDKHFYTSAGFTSLGSFDFEICPQNYSNTNNFEGKIISAYGHNISIESRNAEILLQKDRLERFNGQDLKFHFSSFDPWISENELMEILRCHNRWIVRQPYGIARNRDYFSFQLARFLYFATYSKTNQNTWLLTIVKDEQKGITGYAITECSGTNMRILELIGDDLARAFLWQALIGKANSMGLTKICGFESLVRDFIPNCRMDNCHFSLEPMIKPAHIQCYERLWSQPMFLALNPNLTDIFASNPCSLLEFDYI